MSGDDGARNVAKDNASVGAQIDYVHAYIGGTPTVHIHAGTYESTTGTLQEKFARARRYLNAGVAKKAAELIATVHEDGLETPQVAYYWALALLAGKPFDHLDRDDLQTFDLTVQIAQSAPMDRWSRPLLVIEDLLQCYVADQSDGGVAPERFGEVMHRFDSLSEERREEITRHLALLLSGGLQDSLDAERREQIDRHRLGRDRQRRVSKFFAADPAAPQVRRTSAPDAGWRPWALLVIGLLLLGGAGAALLVGTARTDWRASLAVAAVWVWSVFAGVLFGPDLWYLRSRNKRDQTEFWAAVLRHLAGEPRRHDMPDLDDVLERRYLRVAPIDQVERDRFLQATSREREQLADALEHLYGPESQTPVLTNRIDWLIRWHTADAAERWRQGELTPWPERRRLAPRRAVALVAASVGGVAGFAVLSGTMVAADVRTGAVWSLGAAVAAVLGGWLFIGGTPALTERRRAREEGRQHAVLHEQELEVYHAEERRLADRPTDLEMARWLDYDKDHLRLKAMRRWELSNRDIVAHVVITEAADPSIRARVAGGPSRYTRYLVRLFLLTNNGVRQLAVNLDFASGAENKEVRKAFRYDAIASIEIEEPSVRRHGRRQVATRIDGGSIDGVPRPTLRQAVRLTLLDGSPVEIKTEYEEMTTSGDGRDSEALFELETQASGAISALRTLESVAGEGREWLQRERERSRRTVSDFKRIITADEPVRPGGGTTSTSGRG